MATKTHRTLEQKAGCHEIISLVSQGKSRKDVIQYLMDDGMSYSGANQMYYDALKEMTPDINLLDDYKRGIMQINLDRLEKIINSSIEGNSQDKGVALKAISEINRMLGLSSTDNKVMINKNDKGDEQIIISFQ